jgi:hypothetical protein
LGLRHGPQGGGGVDDKEDDGDNDDDNNDNNDSDHNNYDDNNDFLLSDLSQSFDVLLMPEAKYLKSTPFVWQLDSNALTIATWIRITQRTTLGTVLTLYGLR